MAMTASNSEARHCHTLAGEWSEPGAALTAPALDNPCLRGVAVSDPTPDLIPVDLFWSKIDRSAGPDACWPWQERLNPSGYGTFWVGAMRASRGAHRVAYILSVGPIPAGLQLDHLCRVRHCCNPRHLEPVTLAENLRRGAEARHAESSHCPHGHQWTPENTVYGTHGYRRCRTCKALSIRLSRLRAKGLNITTIEEVPPPRNNAAKTECIRGHDLTDPSNVRVYRGRRFCKSCARLSSKVQSEKRREARAARRRSA